MAKNWFLLSEIALIFAAYLRPSVAKRLHLDFFINKIGIFLVFVFNGMAISVEQLKSATSNLRLLLFTQLYTFAVIPLLTYLLVTYVLPVQEALRIGLLCLASLPCTINMCVTLTSSAGASVPAAIFNAVFSNFIGVFVTPLLVLQLLGSTSFDFAAALRKLVNMVVVPMAVGQALRVTPLGKRIIQRYRPITKLFGELMLLGIVYSTFCSTFLRGFASFAATSFASVAALLVALPAAYIALNYAYFLVAARLSSDKPTLYANVICSSQKTLAFGIPFMQAVFGSRPDIALILTPLLIWSPTQVLVSSTLLVPMMRRSLEGGAGQAAVSAEGRGARGRSARRTLKYVLSVVTVVSVAVELFEELLQDFPLFRQLQGRLRVHHGVLFLTMSHVISHVEELVHHVADKEEAERSIERLARVDELLARDYASEEAAAAAYDEVCVKLLGRYGAAVNFPARLIEPSAKSSSKFRGIYWSATTGAWKVSEAYLGIEAA